MRSVARGVLASAEFRCVLAGALVGLVVGLSALDPGFIAGNGGRWIRPNNDLVSYMVALDYFTVDRWRFPLFDLPSMGYPEGSSVLINDSLPLAALPAKLIYRLIGVRINPFGGWMLLTYLLQGAMAVRVLCALGVRSVWASIAVAILAVANTIFMSRIIHTALSGQFLILWALALHFESVRRRQARSWEFIALLAIALLVNPYLFAMVVVLEAATLGTLALARHLSLADVRTLTVGLLIVAALGIVSGYGASLSRPNSMVGLGYGFYSWNLATLLVPPGGVFGWLKDVPRDVTGGQYEGEAYLGLGGVGLLLAWVIYSPRRTAEGVRRHWLLALALLLLAVHAASNRIYFGNTLLASFDLSPRAFHAASFFRTNGRFIWPLAYALIVLPIAGIFRSWGLRPAIGAAALAIGLQLYDARPLVQSVRDNTNQPTPDLINEPRMDGWLRQHERVWQLPSFWCGGLEASKRQWGNIESNRELQTQFAAARLGVATNSVYTSRWMKDCRAEEKWASAPQLEDGTLYLLSYDAITASPALDQIAKSNACEALQWWVVCSAKWAAGGRD